MEKMKPRIVGKYKGLPVYYDNVCYYTVINGMNFVIDDFRAKINWK